MPVPSLRLAPCGEDIIIGSRTIEHMFDMPRLGLGKVLRPRDHVFAISDVGISSPLLFLERIEVIISTILTSYKDEFAGFSLVGRGTRLLISIVILAIEHAIVANDVLAKRILRTG